MKVVHLILVLLLLAALMMNVRCKTIRRGGRVYHVCSHEGFDIPLDSRSMCESRCQTNFDHAQLQARGMLASDCIRQCNL